MAPYAFKNVDYDALHFHTFSSTLLRGREVVPKKSNLCMLLIMLTVMDDR